MVSNKSLLAILLAVAFCATFSDAAPHRYRRTTLPIDPSAAVGVVCSALRTAFGVLDSTVGIISVTVSNVGVTNLLSNPSTAAHGLLDGGLLNIPFSLVGGLTSGVGGVVSGVTGCVNAVTHLTLGAVLGIAGNCGGSLNINGIQIPIAGSVLSSVMSTVNLGASASVSGGGKIAF